MSNSKWNWAMSIAAGLIMAGTAHGGPVAAGNVLVYRVGSGTGSLVNTGNPVFVDEFTTAGALVQSIALPTTASGAQAPLIASGTATSEGLISLSADGNYLIVAGYGTTVGGTSLSATTSAAVPRVIGRVQISTGNVDTSTALTDYNSANNPRSATSTDGITMFAVGGAGGVRSASLGNTTSVSVATTPANLRQASIFAGQLYVSSGSGTTPHLGTVGTGTPSTGPQTITSLPGFPTTGSQYGFYFADLSSSVLGLDTLYVASDDAGALTKYSLVGGAWTANGTVGVAADTYRGLYGSSDGTNVSLFATRKGGTTATGGGELVSLTDTSGYNGALSGTPTLLATATANTAYRGIVVTPEPGTVGMILVGLLAFAGKRSRRA